MNTLKQSHNAQALLISALVRERETLTERVLGRWGDSRDVSTMHLSVCEHLPKGFSCWEELGAVCIFMKILCDRTKAAIINPQKMHKIVQWKTR